MPAAQNVALTASSSPLGKKQPVVCVVAVDLEFIDILKTELLPWLQVVVRDTYEDLARWTRENGISAVVLDIDTQGEEFGGISILADLRRLNKDFTLISMTRARGRSVESQALQAGADAHFRNPVNVPNCDRSSSTRSESGQKK